MSCRGSRPTTCTVGMVALAIVGCGSTGGGDDVDAAVADGAIGGDIAAPDMPWLGEGVPRVGIAPCPDGWREVVDASDVTVCDPYPEGGPQDCGPGQAHFAGEVGCTPVGAPCPAGDFAEGLPADGTVVYVRPGATAGDGTEARPYGSLLEFSLGALPMETVIALSRGTHEGPIRLSRGHLVQGACAEATIVQVLERSSDEGVITMLRAGGSVRDVTISDSPRFGVYLSGAGVEGSLEAVVVSTTETIGVNVTSGARLSASSLVVRDTAARASDGRWGRGLRVDAAEAEVARAVFHHNREVSVIATEATLNLSDAVIRHTDVKVAGGMFGRGLSVQAGSTATVSRALLSYNLESGVHVSDPGTALSLDQVVVRDTQGRSDGLIGRGMQVQLGATVDVSRAHFTANREVGVVVNTEGTVLSMSDVLVTDTRAVALDDSFGRGVGVQLGGSLDASRVVVARNRDIGMYGASQAGAAITSLSLSDVAILDTLGQLSDETAGRGLLLQTGVSADISRTLVSGNRDAGIFASGAATTATLQDVVVRDTASRGSSEDFGHGLHVQREASVEVARAIFERGHQIGVCAVSQGSATLEDVIVSETSARPCAETSCAGAEFGNGVGVYEPGTTAQFTRFAILGSELCGVHVALDGALDLEDGVVSGHPIGVCLQVPEYDVARLMRDVRYTDNGVNLQASTLPVPEPAELSDLVP